MINKERLLSFFETIVKINSPSKEEKEICEFLKKHLTDLGFECWEDNAAEITGGNSNNLYGLLKGDPNKKSICFNAHIDTVMPTLGIKVINDGEVIKTDGTTILGADDKAGVAIALEAIQSILDQKISHGDIYVLFSVQEEIGVGGANCVEIDKLKTDYCFSFDSGRPVGSMVVAAPTHYNLEFKVIGKSSHAAHSEDSINAIYVASKAIAQLETGMLDHETCCNIGIISGGTRFNIVPDLCEVKIDARAINEEKINNLVDKIVTAFENECQKSGAKLEKEIKCNYKGFDFDQDSELFKLAFNTVKETGVEPVIERTLGGFDASIFNSKGMKTLVFSTGYENYHTNEEYIVIDEFVKTTEIAFNLIKNS